MFVGCVSNFLLFNSVISESSLPSYFLTHIVKQSPGKPEISLTQFDRIAVPSNSQNKGTGSAGKKIKNKRKMNVMLNCSHL